MAKKRDDDTRAGRPNGEQGVLGSLPTTRPSRMSRRARTDEPSVRASAPRESKPAAGRPGPARTQARATGKPRAVRAAAPELREPARKADAARESATADVVEPKPQSGTELVTTVVKAAGELAQLGLTVGGQILKRALPKRD